MPGLSTTSTTLHLGRSRWQDCRNYSIYKCFALQKPCLRCGINKCKQTKSNRAICDMPVAEMQSSPTSQHMLLDVLLQLSDVTQARGAKSSIGLTWDSDDIDFGCLLIKLGPSKNFYKRPDDLLCLQKNAL